MKAAERRDDVAQFEFLNFGSGRLEESKGRQ